MSSDENSQAQADVIMEFMWKKKKLQDKRKRNNCFNPIMSFINVIKEPYISIRLCFKLLYSKALLPPVPPFNIPDMTHSLQW